MCSLRFTSPYNFYESVTNCVGACAVIGEGVAETHSSFNVKAEKAIAR